MFKVNVLIKTLPKSNRGVWTFNVSGETHHPLKDKKYYLNSPISMDDSLLNKKFEIIQKDCHVTLTLASNWNQSSEKIPYRVLDVEKSSDCDNLPFYKTGRILRITTVEVETSLNSGEYTPLHQFVFIPNDEDEKYKCFFFQDDLNKGDVQLTDDLQGGEWKLLLIPRSFKYYTKDGSSKKVPKTWEKVFKFEVVKGELLSLSKGNKKEMEMEEEDDESDDSEIDLFLGQINPIKEEITDTPINNVESTNIDTESNKIFEECKNTLVHDWITEMDRVLEMLNKHYQSVKDPTLKEIYKDAILKHLANINK